MTGRVDEQLATSLDRLVDRLRSLPTSRLNRPIEGLDALSLADATVEVSMWCVAAEAAVVARSDGGTPALHPLSPVSPLSCGDQLRVVAYDLLTALADWTDDDSVVLDGSRVDRADIAGQLTERLAMLRAAS